MRNWLACLGVLFAAVLAITSTSAGQTNSAPRVASGAATSAAPHAAKSQTRNGTPDISGVWNASSGLYRYASFSKDEPPMTPWGLAQFKTAKPSQGLSGVKLDETNDRVYKCQPPGLPYIYIQLFPVQIIQTPKEIIEMFEYDHTVRYIFTDGRKHPDDVQPTYNGHSIGHWEGDTLVVDTVGLNGKNWLDRVGHPESTEMHIVERIRRVDATTLQINFIFDDPKSYSKPWNAQVNFRLHPDWEIIEHVCEDNLEFEHFEK
ncbi:MAG: hypothetical protein ACHQIK_21870 [Candidatus Acidiferrales bacterium]